MNEIWAWVEISDEKVLRTSHEALCEAVRHGRQLHARTTAIAIDRAMSERVVDEIGAYGPDRLLVLQDPALSPCAPAVYTSRLEWLLATHRPDVLFVGSSALSREVAPRLACRLGCGLVTEATYLTLGDDGLVVTRAAYRPHASMFVSFRQPGLQIISLASRVVDLDKVGMQPHYMIERATQSSTVTRDPVEVEAIVDALPSERDLTDADVIVAGGRGMQSKANFKLLDELADVLGGTVAATRMAVDLEWQGRERMVGVSGKVVSPDVYFACGISGAIQHVMGMRSARKIVAINVDPAAPIFRIASLGIVGDVREVLPVMIAAFRQHRAEQTKHTATAAEDWCA